ncbi:MAG TPA: uroporphyrinogen decarboxylase family protein, partial [Bacteroidota bacterium]|nr:uroporphyrinogen decarboxylase family protein [Bacteroidota bacterium]
MNSLERYLGTLKGERVDFLPRIPIVMQYAAEYIGSNYGAFAADHTVLVEANRRCAEDFGFEQLSAISDPYRETQGFGGKVTYVSDGVPRCTAPLEEAKDLSRLERPDPRSSERMADRLKAIMHYKKAFGGRYSIMGWVEGPAAEAADLRSATNFLTDTVDDPDFLGELMDRCLAVAINFARAQIEAGADTIGIGDAIASLLSPRFYEAFIQPREKSLIKAIHDAGAYVRLHICGNITHLLPGIANLGVDILDVDHMVDIVRVRKMVGGKVLSGNIDPVGGILQGTPESIRTFLRSAYQSVGNPFMVAAGCEIPSKTPAENLRAFCEPVPILGT